MKLTKKTFYLIFCLLCFYSCTPPEVNVLFPSEFVNANTVIINGEHNLADHVGENPYSVIKLGAGDIVVSINGTERKAKTRSGGLLNLNEEEFVIFPIFYSNNPSGKDSGSNVPIVVDSVVYINKNSVLMTLPAESRKKMAIERSLKPYDQMKAEIWQTGVIRKTDFFAEKGWELDINDDIPEELTVRTSGDGKKASKTKTILLPASLFKIQALLSDKYWTLDLRE